MSKKILSIEVSNGDAFTDLLFNALLGFAFMFFISFALIQKPQDGGKIDSKAEFIISAEWKDGNPEDVDLIVEDPEGNICLLYTSPSPRDATLSRMPSSA